MKTVVLAESYAIQPLERDLIIAFFDAEEPPFFLGTTMGSLRFVEDHCQDMRFAAVIITDLIGHDATDCHLPISGIIKTFVPQLRKLSDVIGAESNGTLHGIVEAAATEAK